MHIPDLDLCRYHTGPFDADNWSVPLRAIGWLEHPHHFSTGATPPPLVSKLQNLVQQTHATFTHYNFRGVMFCSICKSEGFTSPGPIWSQENIFVPGDGAVYVAPGGVVHYVEAHSYLPPREFIDAVLKCPDYNSSEFRDALRAANGGTNPPFEFTFVFPPIGDKSLKDG
jgi:hypothetical protein